MRLNQVIAVERGIKNRVTEKLTVIYHNFKKGDLFSGFVKTFQPLTESIDQSSSVARNQPDQTKQIQANTTKSLADISTQLTELMDITYLRDATNCVAKADVKVDGQVFLKDVPVTYLLWLEKRLDEVHTEAKTIPTLDPADRWDYDSNQGVYVTKAVSTLSTSKVSTALVLHAPTKEHPAQVKEIVQDVAVGTWNTVKQSAAIPVDRKELLISRVEKLQRAVKQAREEANMTDVVESGVSMGRTIFEFILAK